MKCNRKFSIAKGRMIIMTMEKVIKKILISIFTLFAVIWSIFPVIYLFIISISGKGALPTELSLPSSYSIESWKQVIFGSNNIWPYMLNSIYIASLSTIIGLIVSLPAAYSISRFNEKMNHIMFSFLLVFRMIPYIAIVIPMFLLMNYLHLVDTILGLSISHLVYTIPISVWLMKSFFDVIPKSIEESALIEGASKFFIFRKIALPLAVPGITTTLTISFLLSYIEFLFTSIISRRDTFNLSMYFSTFLSAHDTKWRLMSASALLSVIPMIILFIFAQRFLIRGLTMGSNK